MLKNQRIIYSDDGTEYDLSVSLNNYLSSSEAFASWDAANDYLYIGSDLPFTSKYIGMDVVNTDTAALTVENWYNGEWHAVVDLLDGTSLGGKSLGQSGLIQWRTDKDKGWTRVDDSDELGLSAGLYNLFWCRVKFDADLFDTTSIKTVNHKFCDDTELFAFYPSLSDASLQGAFKSGSTDWDDQSFAASDAIIMELQASAIVFSPAQLMNTEKFRMAAIHKTAQLIYSGMGESYALEAAKAEARYKSAMDMKQFDIDVSGDGKLSRDEQNTSTSYMRR